MVVIEGVVNAVVIVRLDSVLRDVEFKLFSEVFPVTLTSTLVLLIVTLPNAERVVVDNWFVTLVKPVTLTIGDASNVKS